MKYSIKNKQTVFDDHYKMTKAEVTYETFSGGIINTKRLAFERGNSVAILLVEKDTNSVLLTKQFRYPTCKNNDGWILEIPAGSLEENENPKECIEREVMEELGYSIKDPKLITEFYTSPGASTEKISLFYAEVTSKQKTGNGGGMKNEHEDIQLVKVPIHELDEKISEIKDAKTLIAFQFLKLRKLP